MLDALRNRVKGDEQGFTLIELLVVVIIIGILAAIAIPVFLNQRERAWERATMSDMRNASVVLEEVFSADGEYDAGFGTYDIDSNVMTDGQTPANEYPLTISEGVGLTVATNGEGGYLITGTHDNLDPTWELDSAQGVVQEQAAPAPE